MLQAQRTETGGPARVTDGVLFQDCGDGTGLACWTGSAFKAAVSSQVSCGIEGFPRPIMSDNHRKRQKDPR